MDAYLPPEDVILAGQRAVSQREADKQAPINDELIVYLMNYQKGRLGRRGSNPWSPQPISYALPDYYDIFNT